MGFFGLRYGGTVEFFIHSTVLLLENYRNQTVCDLEIATHI